MKIENIWLKKEKQGLTHKTMANKGIREPITLSEIAKILDINKSKLHYYVSIGLIKPHGMASNTMIFEKKTLIKTLTKITKLRLKSIKLSEIKKQL